MTERYSQSPISSVASELSAAGSPCTSTTRSPVCPNMRSERPSPSCNGSSSTHSSPNDTGSSLFAQSPIPWYQCADVVAETSFTGQRSKVKLARTKDPAHQPRSGNHGNNATKASNVQDVKHPNWAVANGNLRNTTGTSKIPVSSRGAPQDADVAPRPGKVWFSSAGNPSSKSHQRRGSTSVDPGSRALATTRCPIHSASADRLGSSVRSDQEGLKNGICDSQQEKVLGCTGNKEPAATQTPRSALREQKKLYALAKQRKSPTMWQPTLNGEVNEAFSPTEPLPAPEETSRKSPVEEVLMSVDRVAEALDRLPQYKGDAAFLRDLFTSRCVHEALNITTAVREHHDGGKDVDPHSMESQLLIKEIHKLVAVSKSKHCKELHGLLRQSHLQAVAYTHDEIANILLKPIWLPGAPAKSEREMDYAWGLVETALDGSPSPITTKTIQLLKDGDMPLGATVKKEEDAVVIGRVVLGGVAEKSGLLKEGDEVLEVNGVDVRGRAITEVCEMLAGTTGVVSFVVASKPAPQASSEASPGGGEQEKQLLKKSVRALFDYDPNDDAYLPCHELGLGFNRGDILHVISTSDERWWQAYRDGEDHPLAGLIPSAEFQEQRERYNRDISVIARRESLSYPSGTFLCRKRGKRKKEKNNNIASDLSPGFTDILTYEEVVHYMDKKDRHRPVVIIGHPSVGCLELRERLLESDKIRFAGVVPHTSRPRMFGEEDGVHYQFCTKQQFQQYVTDNKFVEWGEYHRHYYGTSIDAIKDIIRTGRICVLTLRAQTLPAIRNADIMPFTIFISPPSLDCLKINLQKSGQPPIKDEELQLVIQDARLTEAKLGHYFDRIIVNYDFDRTLKELCLAIRKVETEPQFIPAAWLQVRYSDGFD